MWITHRHFCKLKYKITFIATFIYVMYNVVTAQQNKASQRNSQSTNNHAKYTVN